MYIQNIIDKEFYIQTETNLYLSLMEIKEIERYVKGETIFGDDSKVSFESIVSKIVNGEQTQNDINEEVIAESFNVKEYDKQRTILALLFFEAGRRVSTTNNLSLKDLAKFYDSMYRSFFYGLDVSVDKIKVLLNNLKNDGVENLLLKSRTYHTTGEQLVKECKNIYKEDATDEEIIQKIDAYNNGAYTEFPLAVSALAYICKVRGYEKLWLELFDLLSYFPLQGAMLFQIHTLDEIMALIKWIDGKKHEKVIMALMPSILLRILTDVPEHLIRNCENNRINDLDKGYCRNLNKKWQEGVQQTLPQIVKGLSNKLGIEYFAEWYSKEAARIENVNPQFAKYQRDAIALIGITLNEIIRSNECRLDDASIETLIYYAKTADLSRTEYVSRIATTLCSRTYSDNYVCPFSLSDDGFETMRAIYRCLKAGNVDGLQMLKSYRRAAEGFGVDYKIAAQTVYGDNFWLPILVLQCEDSENREQFKTIIDYLFCLATSGLHHFETDYFLAFYLAELIVTQIMTELKPEFEKRLVMGIPHLIFVLRVLSANEGQIDNNSCRILKERISLEWELEKRIYSGQDKELLRCLDKYINEL